MRYSDEELSELASKINIVDYIEQTEELHRKGSNYFAKCPFHKGDDTPSLCVYPDTNTWHCFGCGLGGTIYRWIQNKENIGFPEAVERVQEILGIEDYVPHVDCPTVKFFKKLKQDIGMKKQYIERPVLDWQTDYCDKYADELPEEWLEEGITPEAIRRYHIRIDHSANRIVYPVIDSEGRFIGVKGRTRLKDYKLLGLQKYINYNKIGTIDYFQGWQQALPAIKQTKVGIIFEGVKSCMKAWGWDIKNTFSSETANLSDAQLQLLIKFGFNEIIIAWDSDQPLSVIKANPKVQMLHRFTKVSVISDTKHLLGEKEAPVDRGRDIFEKLNRERIKI